MDRNLERAKRIHTVVIADGNHLFRRGLRAVFSCEEYFRVLGEASSAAEALSTVELMCPDVLVMDLGLLSASHSQAVSAIRQRHPKLSIVFLTQEDGPEQLELAIGVGGCGYMLKGKKPSELVAGIRQIASSNDQNPSGLSRIIPDLRALASSNSGARAASSLTSREQEVVRLLAEGRTVRDVASELALSVKTVEAHKLNLMRKLDIHNRVSLVQYAVQVGLVTP